jgi:hypothetical protein
MERIENFTDVREIQDVLVGAGVGLASEVEPGNDSGAASITLEDPDGNEILIDQFF